jgi:hypothetical protein
MEGFTLHLLGTSGTQAGGVALPLDLGPLLGTPTGCLLRTDVLLSSLIPISNPSQLFARARQQIAIPLHAAFAGARLHSQWLLFDLGQNTPLPATVSDGLEITLAPLPPPTAARRARTIWKYGAAGNSVDSGRMVLDGYGPILRFN